MSRFLSCLCASNSTMKRNPEFISLRAGKDTLTTKACVAVFRLRAHRSVDPDVRIVGQILWSESW